MVVMIVVISCPSNCDRIEGDQQAFHLDPFLGLARPPTASAPKVPQTQAARTTGLETESAKRKGHFLPPRHAESQIASTLSFSDSITTVTATSRSVSNKT